MTKHVYGDDGGLAYLDHEGVLAETDKAKLFKIEGEEVWLPKSQIEDEGEEIVAVPKWLADAKNLEGSWR